MTLSKASRWWRVGGVVILVLVLITFAVWPGKSVALVEEILDPTLPAEPVVIIEESDLPEVPPPKKVTREEFLKDYGKYFDADFQAQLAARRDKNLDLRTLHRFEIKIDRNPLGWLFIDQQGTVVWTVKFGQPFDFFEEPSRRTNRVFAEYSSIDSGFVRRSGPLLDPAKSDPIQPVHQGLSAIEKDSKWGFKNRDGKLVIPAVYSRVYPFSEGVAAVTTKHTLFSRTGFVDPTGKMVITPQFGDGRPFQEGLAPVFILDEIEEQTVPRVGDSNSVFERGHWGYIDRDGKTVISPKFGRVACFQNGTAEVQESAYHQGIINQAGNYLWQIDLPSEAYFKEHARRLPATKKGHQSGSQPNVTLVLHAVNHKIKFGEIPEFNAELINSDKHAIVIILPGDGSTFGDRTPIVRWKPRMHPLGLSDCGLTNSLTAREIITLQPGERVPLAAYMIGWPTLKKVGKHQVVLEVENVPGLIWNGMSDQITDNSAAKSRARRSTAFKATSEPVEVEVVE
jgi:hypothetical protein